MKRLIVCCDGTWSKPDNRHVTNVEKIARTIQNDAALTDGTPQLVYSISGVGGGSYAADRMLGGAFGFGLSHNVIACYRFLAQNYEPDDEIFIFGFSRGAYTARSLAGMIGYVGLLTEEALVEERLRDAVHIYQQKVLPEGAFGSSVGEFKYDHCHAAKIRFLGVFDTVGALGVPGFRWRTPRFHNIQLGDAVQCARQALAIDETRLIFAPTFWEPLKRASDAEAEGEPATAPPEDDRVKQVWFEGAHSDVGGGYGETGLSDTTLLWMVREAHAAGLIFDAPLLARYVDSGSDPIRHNPLNWGYRLHNAILKAKMRIGGSTQAALFSGGLRRLSNRRALSVRIASSAVNHYLSDEYKPENLEDFSALTNGFAQLVETVTALPERGIDLSQFAKPPASSTSASAASPDSAAPPPPAAG